MRFFVTLLAAIVTVTTPFAATSSSVAPPGARFLQASATASGSLKFGHYAALTLTGHAERFGLSGRYSEVDDLRSGWFAWHADYGISRADEGLYAHGRWRMDASRRVHPLDSHEARIVAITESYLARRGYVHLERDRDHAVPAQASLQRPAGTSDIVAVTPPGGRTALLWIARTDHLVRRIDIRLADRTKTIRYGDYRLVDGVALPFAIIVADGDEPDTGRITVSAYHFLNRVERVAFSPPAENLTDAQLPFGQLARLKLRVDRATTGFAVVLVAINGHGPLPFIVDTGGHDIVTPAVARQLQLKVVGGGATFGAGAASTRTAFTRVMSVSLGDAEVTDQPFVLFYGDLGSAFDAHGHTVPIAGILGLELFERFTVTLDFGKGYLELRPRVATFDGGSATLPITFTSDEPLVEARVNSKCGSFAVDTGNNVGLILYHRWLVDSDVPALRPMRGTMDGDSVGGMVSFRQARAQSLALGTVKRSNVPVLISDARTGSMSSRSEAGRIGLPNFAGLRVTFQYAVGKMILGR